MSKLYCQKVHGSPSGVGPVDVVVAPAGGPPDVAAADLAPGPEVALPVLGDQAQEVVLLGARVQADGAHLVVLAEPLGRALRELGAADTPAHQEVFTLKYLWIFSLHPTVKVIEKSRFLDLESLFI